MVIDTSYVNTYYTEFYNLKKITSDFRKITDIHLLEDQHRIKLFRILLNFSQLKFSKLVGLSRTTIGDLENCKTKINESHSIKILISYELIISLLRAMY